jgi:hypothetical protein
VREGSLHSQQTFLIAIRRNPDGAASNYICLHTGSKSFIHPAFFYRGNRSEIVFSGTNGGHTNKSGISR